VFPILGIVTPVYGSIALLFDLPFLPILLFINGLILLSYRKDSLRVWKEIGKLSFISNRFRKFFIYTSENKKVSKKILRTISKLGDSFEILISPLPHIILNILLFWDLWKIRRFTQWVSHYKSTWNQWTQNLIEYDSLLPFANFSFLHSEFGFPSLNDENVISAESLVHPLLPKKNRVDNPVFPVKKGDLVVITGSNMSGKTTYLRSVAVSLLLARAGAKVAGKGFQFPTFTIHTLIRSQDSLEDGVSFFYSEVRRLAEILKNADSEKQIPILFLDEILKGTNSKERYIATRELLFALKEKGAIVFVTTHDLKLSEIPWAQQFHFTELEVDGNMEFDYKIRKGVSTSTNALRILKKEGIPIRNEDE
jgi:DNA mismatch repair ATPase MutS